jgi:hypothetical protein
MALHATHSTCNVLADATSYGVVQAVKIATTMSAALLELLPRHSFVVRHAGLKGSACAYGSSVCLTAVCGQSASRQRTVEAVAHSARNYDNRALYQFESMS